MYFRIINKEFKREYIFSILLYRYSYSFNYCWKARYSKSLSIQLIIRLMRREFSNSNFLKNYPSINNTGFKGSETNTL